MRNRARTVPINIREEQVWIVVSLEAIVDHLRMDSFAI